MAIEIAPLASSDIPFNEREYRGFAEGIGHFILQYNGLMLSIGSFISNVENLNHTFHGKDRTKINKLEEILKNSAIPSIETAKFIADIKELQKAKDEDISHCTYSYDPSGNRRGMKHQVPGYPQVNLTLKDLGNLVNKLNNVLFKMAEFYKYFPNNKINKQGN